MRRGLFGGSFDPVHYGHLLLAETCREACRLDEVGLTPAGAPPHKLGRNRASPQQRFDMVRLAVADAPGLIASPLEIERQGVSYTIDTLEALRATEPQGELFLLLGGDSLRDFATWREPHRIVRLATLVVVRRGNQSLEQLTTWRDQLAGALKMAVTCEIVEMPAVELSSTDLRRRVRQGHSIRFRTPPAVQRYIAEHSLYHDVEPDDWLAEPRHGPAAEGGGAT